MLLFFLLPIANAADAVKIAVAANFKPTLIAINKAFEAGTGHKVIVSSASSGTLANQLILGAPFDIFFSADKTSPSLVANKLHSNAEQSGNDDFFCYARGQLVLLGGNSDLNDLADPTLSLAIANPATAPYGRAAMQVIERPEFAGGLSRKLVRGNNAVQAYQFWHTSSTVLALAPLSLVRSPTKGTNVPTAWYSPIEQYALIMNRSDAVDAYMKWFRSDTVQAMIHDVGYLPCR
ncbi:MAG: molybdate ABC transporter substrate-binding protein [Halioglobus sp.]